MNITVVKLAKKSQYFSSLSGNNSYSKKKSSIFFSFFLNLLLKIFPIKNIIKLKNLKKFDLISINFNKYFLVF